ncbi:MAG: aldolase catalytic domain-containing protein [Blautia sp.]|nr:aldolase catalytic domain-containing protein [Blautia sp.]MCM1200773.1 aldolase catalytic domain-containing protein [Bacteroides fragilis]
MWNVQLLDCTLRDGGRIIDCKFDDTVIMHMVKDLTLANIDIVEMGFLRDDRIVEYKGNSTFFTEISQITPFLPRDCKNTIYTAFIDYDMYDFSKLDKRSNDSITGIRVGFTKKQFIEEKERIEQVLYQVKEKGYTLFVQGVNSLAYTDRELLDLIDMMNEVGPYSFGIVDTYGAMYLDDIVHFYHLIDYNLDSNICVDIHSHNNFQSSFAFAQEVIRLANGKRKIILDATLNGMGKCAGNLNTELIADYLVRKRNGDYDIDRILDAIDTYLVPIKNDYEWGYSIPAFMAGIYKSHPNNVIYLTKKYRLNSRDIKYILSGIEENVRQRYDYDNIQQVYRTYNENLIDDKAKVKELYEKLHGKSVLVLVPGKSVHDYYSQIEEYIQKNNPIVISINFIPSKLKGDYFFCANTIHWQKVCDEIDHKHCIITSNIHESVQNTLLVDYSSLIEEDSKLYDNSTIMLLNLLKKVKVSKVAIAGFDGLKENGENYINLLFSNRSREMSVTETNKEIRKLFEQYKAKVDGKIVIEMLTPSIYEKSEL